MGIIEHDSFNFINLLRSSVELNSLKEGKLVHCLAIVSNLCGIMSLNTALLSMYSKLGHLKNSQLIFQKIPEKDSVVWNLIIQAHSRNGFPTESMKLLMQMASSGVRANMVTTITALSSIIELKSLKWGKQLHANVIRNGTSDQASAVSNSLIDMYCKCDRLEVARKIFDLLANRTVVTWSSMIKGYVSRNLHHLALSLFADMKLAGIAVNCGAVINVLAACVNIGALEQLKVIHGHSLKLGLDAIPSLNTAMLVSYAKCGCLEIAQRLFDGKDLISWNSMIGVYSKHGEVLKCFEVYDELKKSKLKPDRVTFLELLTACVNSGSVHKGWWCFREMTERYGCEPDREHYGCMVDLLGRSGCVDEAREVIKTMPGKPDSRVWKQLLSACKLHSEMKVAESAGESLLQMEPQNAGNYVLLANIYAAAGKWEGAAKLRTCLRDRGLKKTPGCSWLEISGRVHEFCAADTTHPKSLDIYKILGTLELEIKDYKIIKSR